MTNNTDTRKAIQALMHALYPNIISPTGLSDQDIRDGQARAERVIRDIKKERKGQEK